MGYKFINCVLWVLGLIACTVSIIILVNLLTMIIDYKFHILYSRRIEFTINSLPIIILQWELIVVALLLGLAPAAANFLNKAHQLIDNFFW